MNMDFFKMWQTTFEREINSRRIKAMDAIIFVTYRCTSRCSTCNIWQRTRGNIDEFRKGELSPLRWSRIMEKLSRSAVSSIEVFGGDALLRKDIVYSMIKRSTRLGIDTFFPTNSNLLDKNTAKELVSSGLGTAYFSIDGINELHNRIRGVDATFTRVEQALRHIYDAKAKAGSRTPRIGILTTISNMNVEKIEEILFEFEKFKIDFVYLRALGEITPKEIENSVIDGIPATPYFVSTSEDTHLLSEEQTHILRYTLRDLWHRRKTFPFRLGLSQLHPLTVETFTKGLFPKYCCHLCTAVLTLTPVGDVIPCPFFSDYVLGNLEQEDSLESIWGNYRHRFFVEKQREGEFAVCRKCSMRHFYPGIRETFRQVFDPYFHTSFFYS